MSVNKMLLVFFDETDQWNQIPLYEAVVRRMRQLGLAGATVNAGIMGFGSHQEVHRKRLFGISDDRPVTVMAIDTEEKLRAAIPEIRQLVREGLMILVDVEAIPLEPG
jgi:uncharacterized protein